MYFLGVETSHNESASGLTDNSVPGAHITNNIEVVEINEVPETIADETVFESKIETEVDEVQQEKKGSFNPLLVSYELFLKKFHLYKPNYISLILCF